MNHYKLFDHDFLLKKLYLLLVAFLTSLPYPSFIAFGRSEAPKCVVVLLSFICTLNKNERRQRP